MNRGQQAIDELAAIETALRAAGVPAPFAASGRAVAWVAVALAELGDLAGKLAMTESALAAAQATAAIPAQREPLPGLAAIASTVAAAPVPPERQDAITRVASRMDRKGCPTPEKRAAYNPTDREEQRLADRRRKPGQMLYPCDCGWHHLGTPLALRVDPQPMPDEPITWARMSRQVALLTGCGDIHVVGRVVRYEADPTVVVETADGKRVPWRADLARAIDDNQEAAS